MLKHLKLGAKPLFTAFAMNVLRFFKSHVIWGSKFGFFSVNNVFGPLTGYYGNTSYVVLVYAFKRLIHCLYSSVSLLNPISWHIPAIIGGLYLSVKDKKAAFLIRFFLPAVCMVLFATHPIGSQAWVYSLYWLIPCALYFVPRKNIFLMALGSTFVTHAVGSVLWLYFVPSDATLWLGLLPVVVFERLTFATGMVMTIKVVDWLKVISGAYKSTVVKKTIEA